MRKKTIYLTLCITILLSSCRGEKGVDSNMIPFKKDGKTIYVNHTGKTVLELDTISGSAFSDGLALAYSSKGIGFINKDGKYVIKPEYKRALSFSEGMAWVVKENGFPEVINKEGKILFSLKQAQTVNPFNEGLAVFESKNEEGETLYGCVDKSGKIIIEPQLYKLNNTFNQGKIVVRNDSYKYGYMDQSGKIIINCQFDKANDFGKNDLACVKLGDKWGVINEKGEYVINPRFNAILPDGDWFVIAENSKTGWVDKTGKYIINPQFKSALPFYDADLAPVYDGENWGYINRMGTLLSGYQYQHASPFIDNNIAVVSINDSFGFINKDGKYIVNPQYSDVDKKFLTFTVVPFKLEEQIYTDYLDIDLIVQKVSEMFDIGVVAGVSYTSPVSKLMTDYKLSESSFPKNGSSTEIKKGHLPGQTKYTLKMNGNTWTRTQGTWFANYTLNSDFIPPSYSLFIELNYLHHSKTRQLASAIYKAISGGLEFHDVEDGYECRTNNNLGVSYKDGVISISAYNYTLMGDDPTMDMDYAD